MHLLLTSWTLFVCLKVLSHSIVKTKSFSKCFRKGVLEYFEQFVNFLNIWPWNVLSCVLVYGVAVAVCRSTAGLNATLFCNRVGARQQWRRKEVESIRHICAGKCFIVVHALHFLALQVQLVVLVSAFVIVSTVWSVSSSSSSSSMYICRAPITIRTWAPNSKQIAVTMKYQKLDGTNGISVMFWKFVCSSCTGCRQAVSSMQPGRRSWTELGA